MICNLGEVVGTRIDYKHAQWSRDQGNSTAMSPVFESAKFTCGSTICNAVQSLKLPHYFLLESHTSQTKWLKCTRIDMLLLMVDWSFENRHHEYTRYCISSNLVKLGWINNEPCFVHWTKVTENHRWPSIEMLVDLGNSNGPLFRPDS